jgi:chemotaxis protein MotB
MSYSDMMAATLLMFVMLLFLSFIRYTTMRTEKDDALSEYSVRLQERETDLVLSQDELAERQGELDAVQAAYYLQQLELDRQAEALSEKEEEISQSLAKMLLQEKAIEEQNALLAMSQEEIDLIRAQLDAQKTDLDAKAIMLSARDAQLLAEKLRVTDLETLLNQQKSELDTQAQQIDELVGVRARIIEQLRDAFYAEGLPVTVDQSGAITMDSTIFFDTAMSRIKTEGQRVLSQLLPIYFQTLMKEGNFEYVSEIIVEGHTDSDGTYERNLELSQRRAQAVVTYCLSDDFKALTAEEKDQLRKIITANGRSKSQLIYGPDGQEDKAASRRVEIKFRLNDAEMVESMSRILAGFQ